MTNDRQDKILASSEGKDCSETGGKNSKDADLIKFERKTDMKNKNNSVKLE